MCILTRADEMYTGTLVQGKKERVSYKVKKSLPKKTEDWIRVLDCHEAIVTKEEYAMVQKLLRVPVRAGKNTGRAHLFAGLLFCADCKKPLIRRINRYKGKEKVFYICSTKNKGLGCSRHSIEEHVLQDYLDEIIKHFSDEITCKIEPEKAERRLETDRKTEQGREERNLETDHKAEQGEEERRLEADYKTAQGRSEERLEADCITEQGRSAEMLEELEKLKKYRESYQKLCLSLEENLANGILTKEEADSLFQIYKEQEEGIEEMIAKQQAHPELKDDPEEESERRTQELFLISRIEVEERGSVIITLHNGKQCRLPEGKR